MANSCKHLIKTVIHSKPKVLTGLNQKVREQARVLAESPVMGVVSPVDRMSLKRNKSEARNTVSPTPSLWVVTSQGAATGQWVEEDGKSEGRPVMGWIRAESGGDIALRDKRADFHHGLSSRENRQNHQGRECK